MQPWPGKAQIPTEHVVKLEPADEPAAAHAVSATRVQRQADETATKRRVRPRRAAFFRLEPGARVRAKFREGWALGRIVERSAHVDGQV